MIDGNLTPISH